MSTLTAKEPGATYRVVTARKEHYCADRYATYCPKWIKPGDKYVRAVMFPSHDVYAYVDETGGPLRSPVVNALCFECASAYHITGLLVIDAEKQARS